MNAKNFFFTTSLAYIFLATISGCSESTKKAPPLPDLTSAINFPYIENNSLYSFDPRTGLSEKLFTANTKLILALDTDESTKESTNNSLIIKHSVKAEYFAYANAQTLHLYDIDTRIDHQLYDFKQDIMFDPISNSFVPAPESYICDIQKIITWDKEARLAKRVLYKDEFALYVKTSTNENCQDTETPFSYWQINIEESSETLTRRRKILREHSHDHTHQHEHDDENYELFELHDHVHSLKDELDENFDPNNHEHNHKHLHDFLFENEHEHEHLTLDEIDAVHNNPKNQEIKFETYPKFIGKKTTIDSSGSVKVEAVDEALMYSGRPLLDINNRTFGYLGFNTTENTLKFYTVADPDRKNFVKKQIWQLTNTNFNTITNDQPELSDLEKLIPRYNRFSNFQYANNGMYIITDNKIIFLALSDLFDDDSLGYIEESISNPLFTSNISTPKLKDRVSYNESYNKMSITEDTTIWSIDFFNNSPSEAIKVTQLNEPNLIKVASTHIENSSILIEKSFNNNGIQENSIVVLQETGLESQTILPKTPDALTTTVKDNYVLMSLTDADLQNKRAQYFTPQLGSPTPFSESIWPLDGVDYRNNNEQKVITLISSDTDTNANEINSVTAPKLYLFKNDANLGQGEDFGYIPQNVVDVKKVVILSDLYGLIEVTNTDSSTSTYFFSNKKSSFNFNNEYKNMKLLQPITED